MQTTKSYIKKALLICSGVLFAWGIVQAQLPTFTVDEDFDTEDLFRSSGGVSVIHRLDDGRILFAGGFKNGWSTPEFNGVGMIWEDGTPDLSWPQWDFPLVVDVVEQEDGFVFAYNQNLMKTNLEGITWQFIHGDWWVEYNVGGNTSPYSVESVWSLYEQEDEKIILAGSIANDTPQPGIFRCLSRINADGTHDPSFPGVEPGANSPSSHARKIFRASNGYWYISGGFESINGHVTPHLARLTPEFEVDTDFVSPFLFEGLFNNQPQLAQIDSQDRLWVSGGVIRLNENPIDTVQVIRLTPDGNVDSSFLPRHLSRVYPEEWNGWFWEVRIIGVVELASNPGHYLLHGRFNYFENELRECILVVDDFGNVQENYFDGQVMPVNDWGYHPLHLLGHPRVSKVVELENGDLLVGGRFSEFMGSTRYNMVKLNLSVIDGVEENELNRKFKLWPNPANQVVNISFEGLVSGELKIMNLQGELVQSYEMQGAQARLDISELPKGVYFVMIETESGTAVKKMVVN